MNPNNLCDNITKNKISRVGHYFTISNCESYTNISQTTENQTPPKAKTTTKQTERLL